jgi:molybdopterin synthase catalytic subunit
MSENKHLISGPISPVFVTEKLSDHQDKTNIGAHAFFLGQVREDKKEEHQTAAIEYTAYEEMVGKVITEIKDSLFAKYDDLICMHIYHSTGMVKIGEISLFVLVSSGHRKQSFAALEDCIELIKEKLPVWKKEIFNDGSHHWQGA